ncbi:MAG: hypothetical protein WC712_09935 [Candidatus Brocadiia bacterium]
MNPNCVIESIPNFSEGRRPEVISEIVNGVRSVEGVKVLGCAPGQFELKKLELTDR